jgi:hypothetical protein
VVIGLYGLAAVIPIWGIAPAVLLHVAMHFMNYFGSRYLNEIAASEQRATILSFKGLATNIAYGMTAVLYSVLFASIRSRTDSSAFETTAEVEESIFVESLAWLPSYFLLMLGLLIAGLTLRFSYKKAPKTP